MNKQLIEKYFDESVSRISEALDNFPFENQEATVEFFSQQFLIIQHTTRYLSMCASLIDPNSTEEFHHWMEHLTEERGHDLMLKNDLKKLGYSQTPHPYPETKALIEANYYGIQKYTPYTLLGHGLMLEGLALYQCRPLHEKIKKLYGVSMNYLEVHATADEKHYPEGIQMISELPEHLQKQVVESLKMSSALYFYLIESVKRQFLSQKQAA